LELSIVVEITPSVAFRSSASAATLIDSVTWPTASLKFREIEPATSSRRFS
jgi:hypothetical protein